MGALKEYKQVRDKIKGLVEKRMTINPNAMDIGTVGKRTHLHGNTQRSSMRSVRLEDRERATIVAVMVTSRGSARLPRARGKARLSSG